MTAAELARPARHILLDFDGPVCAVFGHLADHVVAERLRAVLAEHGQPARGAAASAHDPFEVLACATELGTEIAGTVEAAFQATEVEAVSQAPQTPGLPAVLDYLTSEGRIVTIVSNNSTVAIETYLRQAGLDHYVAGVSARTAADITRLKPNPHLLQQAIPLMAHAPANV